MARFLSLRRKTFILFLITVAVFCLSSALAQRGPAQIVTSALFCFNNKFIFNRCNQAYRLNESGELDVPPEATNEFCNGACLHETQGLLKCINSIVSRFTFNNGAPIGAIRGTLDSACSFTSRRGNFNVGDYMESELSNSFRLPKPTTVYPLVLMTAGWIVLVL